MGLVVFTDLDGTLLDHDSYSHAPAAPALAALKARGIPLVLASSKTAAEIAELHGALGLGDVPAIVENGAGLYEPGEAAETDGAAYARIRAALADLPRDLQGLFRGFGDMSAAEVSDVTGLAPEAAARAKRRAFSEPGLWQGGDGALERFTKTLEKQGITGRMGGRFLTLSFGKTKAGAMRDVAERLGATCTLALGDAPNDVEMLEAADIGIIVRNDHAPPLPPLAGEAAGRIRRTARPGPEGWNAAVLGIVQDSAET